MSSINKIFDKIFSYFLIIFAVIVIWFIFKNVFSKNFSENNNIATCDALKDKSNSWIVAGYKWACEKYNSWTFIQNCWWNSDDFIEWCKMFKSFIYDQQKSYYDDKYEEQIVPRSR